jgi:hypothetical protein
MPRLIDPMFGALEDTLQYSGTQNAFIYENGVVVIYDGEKQNRVILDPCFAYYVWIFLGKHCDLLDDRACEEIYDAQEEEG